jgi:hypothetical protein
MLALLGMSLLVDGAMGIKPLQAIQYGIGSSHSVKAGAASTDQ